jgi:Icc protein
VAERRVLSRALLAALLLSVPTWATSCIRPTEERAERDLEIGRVSLEGFDLEVSGGLAAVRSAKPGEIALWSSAPAYRLHVRTGSDAPELWTLSVENCMPDALLQVGSGTGVTVTEVVPVIATKKRWLLTLPPGTDAMLDLAPPDAGDLSPWRFAVMSDVQEAIDRVQDIYQKMDAVPNLRFLLGAGDLTQQGGNDELARFQNELRGLDVPYYTTLGNHELGSADTPYQDWFGRASFHFEYRGVAFSMLDSGGASIDPMVYDWLDGWLDGAKDRVHVVATHIPPVDPIGVRNGSFASRNEAAKLLTRLAKGKVDLTLYGHIHSYYDFDNAGIPAYISGGGGAIPEKFDGIGRHFLVVDVDPEHGVKSVSVVRVD